ncbi:MAG: metal-dependent transcriptional regulator [Longimicrobiales bacterium]|nr:metal-dependent transcriptional regulator [Longimicrobiales bacterium]
MVDPLVALLVFTGLVAVLAVLLWPRRGLVARVRKVTYLSDRVLLEDALKHVYTCESVGRACTLESLAGRLEISRGHAADLLSKLAASELTRHSATGPKLTEKGRASALQLVRTHRLWERYLADRTGVPAGEWHQEAERMEHALSREEADELAARLGHPAWDPHGDPIPTSTGDLPAMERTTLASVSAGQAVEVIHVEDEPRVIYDALLEDGLDVGARVDVVARDGNAVTISARGREWSIDPIVAGNVTVRPLPQGVGADTELLTLADLPAGGSARVLGISPACKGAQRRRLLDLGIVRGTVVESALRSAGGDPIAYRVRGALIALRREQAEWVRVESLSGADEEASRSESAHGASREEAGTTRDEASDGSQEVA